jgi:hypothetical protein
VISAILVSVILVLTQDRNELTNSYLAAGVLALIEFIRTNIVLLSTATILAILSRWIRPLLKFVPIIRSLPARARRIEAAVYRSRQYKG